MKNTNYQKKSFIPLSIMSVTTKQTKFQVKNEFFGKIDRT